VPLLKRKVVFFFIKRLYKKALVLVSICDHIFENTIFILGNGTRITLKYEKGINSFLGERSTVRKGQELLIVLKKSLLYAEFAPNIGVFHIRTFSC
jgi:hypothetical protein